MELQKMRVYKYWPDDEKVCALRYPKKYLSEETLCGLGIYKRIIDNDKFKDEYHDAIDEPFSGGYGDIICCGCRKLIDNFVEQSTGGREVELQKMKCSNGEELVCAVRYTPVEHFAEETVCGIVYNTDEKVVAWIADRFGERLSDEPTPIGKSFEGRYSDITCQECRDVIEYYQRPEASKV